MSSDTNDIVVDDIMMVDTKSYFDQKDHRGHPQAKNDLFYFKFENVFRCSEEEIKTRQAKYMEYVLQAYKLSNKAEYFLDVGCGRGEFLELLVLRPR